MWFLLHGARVDQMTNRLYDRLWGAGFLPTQHQGSEIQKFGRSGALSVRSERNEPFHEAGYVGRIGYA